MKTLRIIAAFLALSAPATAQVVQLQPGQVLGNSTAARALAQPASVSAMLDRALTGGTTQGAVATRNASAWIALAPGTAGLPLLSQGAAANLAYGILGLAAGGTNANLTANNGGIFYSTATAGAILAGTATPRQMLQSGTSAAPAWSTTTWPATTTINRLLWSSAASVISDLATTNGGILNAGATGIPAMTVTPVLGVPTASTGTLGFAGVTSGTATITPQAAAGTPTLTLPNASGTFAVSVSAPLALSATTGNLTIIGAAGQVLAGATPAFTSTPTLGASGTLGTIAFGNATSGTITLQPVAGALGSAVLTMPAATDTIAVLAASQAFTNKTYNGNTWTAGTGTLTIAASKTLTANNSITLAGTDTTTMTFPGVSATIPRAVLTSTAKAMATGAIASATCTTEQTLTATGTLTTDTVTASFNGDPTAITGFVPLTTGMLSIIVYPKADAVGIKECNNSSASITPGAHTLNISVLR